MALDLDFPTDVIEGLMTGTYSVTRRIAGQILKGRSMPGESSDFTIEASVQPATGRDLLRLPEGRRATETMTVFTPTKLLVGGQGAANEADLIDIDGVKWEIQHAESWPGYCRALAQRPG